MSGNPASRRAASTALLSILLLVLILISVASNLAYPNSVTVSPGKYDLTLGAGFPTFGPVKLSYPNSSILTNSVGDLLFTVNLTLDHNGAPPGHDSVRIYVPPDFSGLSISKLWTSYSNDYNPRFIQLSRLSSSDVIGPSWWEISIGGLVVTNDITQVNPANRTFIANQTQYIRLFQVTSPSIAGRYFFKAFINGASIPVKDYPTIVVKASRDPAYISGTLRDLGDRTLNLTNVGRPIDLPNGYGAQVLATGIDYLGRPVSAQAFINATRFANGTYKALGGSYTLFGVAPGTYNLTAYAAGYIPAILPYTVSVAATQSLEGVDIYMSKSANVSGTVLSENHEGALIPWGSLLQINRAGFSTPVNRSISIRILNLDGSVVASIPAPFAASLFTDNKATSFHFSIQRELGWDGRIPQEFANYTSGLSWGDYLLQAFVTSYVQLVTVSIHVTNETTDQSAVIPLIRTGSIDVTVHFRNSNGTIGDDRVLVNGTLSVSAYDMQGILRAQNVAFVRLNATTGRDLITNEPVTTVTVELEGFSSARSFGSFSLFSQNYGLLPGTYYIRARFTSAPIIVGFANLPAPLPSTLVAGDLYYQTMDVQATVGWGPEETEISFPLYKAGGVLLTISSIDTETPPVSVPWKYRGATMSITLIPISQQNIYQTNTTQPALIFVGKFPQTRDQTLPLNITGLKADEYDLFIRTLGYTQERVIRVSVVLGYNTDVLVPMIENPVIELTLNFRHEGLLSFINSTQPYAQPINHIDGTPTRIEVFDEQGNFVAAIATYIPNNVPGGKLTRVANFTLAGFDIYYGDPRLVWSGFYDTTDAARQAPGGLFLYPWNNEPQQFTIRIWVDGYYQLTQLQVTVPPRENVSVVQSMDRASRISGTILGPDYYDLARPLSWATITLQPDNYTLTRIIDVRPGNYTTSSLDGSYQLWAPEGTYGIGATLAGYSSYSAKLEIPTGSDISVDIWLDNYSPSAMAMNATVGPAATGLTVFCLTPSYGSGGKFAQGPSECNSAASHKS